MKKNARYLDISVLQAAENRISEIFDDFEKIYVSFSGGKDSGVLLHLTMQEAIKRNRKIGVLIVDLEAQYKMTVDYLEDMVTRYERNIELFWVALPLVLRNAVSVYEPRWICWDPDSSKIWVRSPPTKSITDDSKFPFFRKGMEFEEFVPSFGEWYADGKQCANLVGIRSDESINRYRTIFSKTKIRFKNRCWTTSLGNVVNCYPIYDWNTRDIWRFNSKGYQYNRIYDLMQQAGIPLSQQRLCQPFGDDQRKGLHLYHVIEPDTWGKLLSRVAGVNSGTEFVQYPGSCSGQVRVSKPDHHTWESYARLILDTLPVAMKEHYLNKIYVFTEWYLKRGYDKIPDDSNDKEAPSWKRITKTLLRNDYWAKGLGFSQTKSDAYDRYMERLKKRRKESGFE